MKVAKDISFALIWVAVIALIVGLIVFFSKLTNGFQEDFKTFYLTYENTDITANDSKLSIKPHSENRFDVKYVLGFSPNENADKTYTVEIIPNSEYEDLTYTVDGETYLFGDIEDFSDVFNLEQAEDYFVLSVSDSLNLLSVLSAKYPDQTVEIPDKFATANNYYYILRVSTYNGKTVYNIKFNFDLKIDIDKDGVEF